MYIFAPREDFNEQVVLNMKSSLGNKKQGQRMLALHESIFPFCFPFAFLVFHFYYNCREWI